MRHRSWKKSMNVTEYAAYYYNADGDDEPAYEHHVMIDEDIPEAESKVVDMLLIQMNRDECPIVDIERRYTNWKIPMEYHTYTYNEDTHSYELD